AEGAGRPCHAHGFARLQIGRDIAAIRHHEIAERTPGHHLGVAERPEADGALRWHAAALGPRTVVEVTLQAPGALAAGGQALQDDVGGLRVVARAHRGVAEHPVAGDELGRVGPNFAHAADAARTWDHR